MISSAFGNFRKLVKLFSVHNIKASDMVPITKYITDVVQECGFEILFIISDNHAINKTSFKNLTSDGKSPNPKFHEKSIFVL